MLYYPIYLPRMGTYSFFGKYRAIRHFGSGLFCKKPHVREEILRKIRTASAFFCENIKTILARYRRHLQLLTSSLLFRTRMRIDYPANAGWMQEYQNGRLCESNSTLSVRNYNVVRSFRYRRYTRVLNK